MEWLDDGKGMNMETRNDPPPYKKIKANKLVAKFQKTDYNACKCSEDELKPCSAENRCWNVATKVECDPDKCAAKQKCQNQQFRRGTSFAFDVKKTESKGWGLFAKDGIPANSFIIEYKGEVIDDVEFKQRFSRATANIDVNYYFLKLDKNLYIDAKDYGNEARFINHSCDPNSVPIKWSVCTKGSNQTRVGLFALRNIRKVDK